MSEKELEERVMLDKKQFLVIKKYIQENFPHYQVIHQKNRYFDDKNNSVHKLKNMLRIRSFQKSTNRELTYKVKGDDGDIEYNQTLSHYWFYEITRCSRLPEGQVKDKLIEDKIDVTSLKTIVDLLTRRIEVRLDDCTIVLDANLYNDITDYNLEIESKISKSHAKAVLLDYCSRFNIEYKDDYLTKSARAFMSIKK